jgi:hypothetical protein
MPVLVTIRSGDTHRTLAADGLERDRLLPDNLVLTGVRDLDLGHPDGSAARAYLWSVPASLVVSYAMVKAPVSPPAEPTPEPLPEPKSKKR